MAGGARRTHDVAARCEDPPYGLNAFLPAFAAVHANDPASARVLEKAGFACEGVQKSAVVKRGELLDLIVYARVRDSLESSS